ncbi:hypothetical protein MAPG_05785 [Magnaporthiopsis poae ATCC 64411]|uniref:Uncharacterized protein n=1 Tax=Magnaporthiopsis poae (strain ATCC 64411 / 73-15) TaxID=644358 RepID=A0A0C4E0B5_MAGP6|nr:hypothetical protein MAPG_05785 [Magnaporthiopsis poae ATCC 64411]
MSRHRGHKGHGAGPHNQNGNGNNRNNNNNNNNNNGNGNGNHRNGNRNNGNGNRNNGNNNNNNNNGGYNNGNGNRNNNNNHRNRNNNNRNGNGGNGGPGGNNGNGGQNRNPGFGHPLSQIFGGYFQQRQNQGNNNGQHQQGAQMCRYNPCTRGNCQRAHAPGQQTNFQGGGGGPVQNRQQRQQGGNGGDASLLAKLTLCRNNPCTQGNCHRVHAPGQRATVQGGGHPGGQNNHQQNMFPSGGWQQRPGGGASALLKMFQQLQQQQQQQQPFFVDGDGDVIMCECGGHPDDASFCCRDQYELLCASDWSLERSGKALAEFSAALYNEMGLGQDTWLGPGYGMRPEDLMRMLGELFASAGGGGGPRRKGRRGGGAQAGPFANPGYMQDMIL